MTLLKAVGLRILLHPLAPKPRSLTLCPSKKTFWYGNFSDVCENFGGCKGSSWVTVFFWLDPTMKWHGKSRLHPITSDKIVWKWLLSMWQSRENLQVVSYLQSDKAKINSNRSSHPKCMVHISHWAIVALTSTFNNHVQVTKSNKSSFFIENHQTISTTYPYNFGEWEVSYE